MNAGDLQQYNWAIGNLKWLTNTYDPQSPNAKRYFVSRSNENHDEAWERYLLWLADKMIGEPMPSEGRTVDEMKKANMVGVYRRDEQ